MNNFERLHEELTEKSLSDGEVTNMLNQLVSKTKDAKSGSGVDINKMAKSMLSKDGDLSPDQVKWAMQTSKSLS